MKSISWYVASGHKSSATMPSSASAVLRTAAIAGSTSLHRCFAWSSLLCAAVLSQQRFELRGAVLQVLHEARDFVERVGIEDVADRFQDWRRSKPVRPGNGSPPGR